MCSGHILFATEQEMLMAEAVLGDRTQYPDQDLIFSHLGKNRNLWIRFFDYLHKERPQLAEEWHYYNDGKSWLMKVTHKSKTVFWLSILEGEFRITFYFSEKILQSIDAGSIPETLKGQFMDGTTHGKIRGITVTFRRNADLEDAKTLLGMKLSAPVGKRR